MINLQDIKEKCYGCCACQNICPTKAIRMQYDEYGFLVPKITINLCINCNMCENVCVIDHIIENTNNPEVYAAVHKDYNTLMNSSSGGIFTALSDYILSDNGVVIGAVYDSLEKKVVHILAETKEERNRMRGSKYVQSDLGIIYEKINAALKEGKKVLFVGTACQINGLYNYLGLDRTSKLITCDILCHGVASPLMLKKCVEFIERKNNIEIENIDFRNKKSGWKTPHPIVTSQNREYTFEFYMKIYYKDIILRECCYQCPYTNMNRISDITIGDFWGIENMKLDIEYSKGCSLVFANTIKGQQILQHISNSVTLEKCSIYNHMQTNLEKPTEKPDNREKFWNDFWNREIGYIAMKYGEYGIVGKFEVCIRKCKNKFREIIG